MMKRGFYLFTVLCMLAGLLPSYASAANANAFLSGLTMSGGTAYEDKSDALFLSYYADVANDVSEITVTPTAQDSKATIQVNAKDVDSGSASEAIALDVGVNTIAILVKAEDGAQRNHTLTVIRAGLPGSDAKLSFLNVTTEDKRPFGLGFNSSLPNYDIGSVTDMGRLLVKPDLSDIAATVTINGIPAASGKDNSVDLSLGTNTITVKVTAQDGTTTRIYTVKVKRLAASDAYLNALTISSGTIARDSTDNSKFAASVTSGVGSISVTPTTRSEFATIKVDGEASPNGGASRPIALNVGSNTIAIMVTAEDGTTQGSYTLTVTRPAAAVTFNSQGGSPVAGLTDVMPGTTISEPITTREGHSFLGWYADSSYSKKWHFDTDIVESDLTLYAKWVQAYTIVFEAQGGSGTIAYLTGVTKGPISAPVSPVREGYTFAGWYSEASYVTPWYFETDIVNKSMTLYAKWTEGQSYTVSFDSQGGPAFASLTGVGPGEKIRIPLLTREGHYLEGWYKEPSYATQWNFAADTVNADTTLYGKWVAVYTVTFDTQGGSAVPDKLTYSGTIPTPATPTKSGYIFTGWYKDASLTTEWNFSADPVNKDMTLYAGWFSEPGYTVTFDVRGGIEVDSITGLYPGAKIPMPAGPYKEGEYEFDGWYKEASLETPWNVETDTLSGDTTLYAKWKDSTYSVTFEIGSGYFEGDLETRLLHVSRGAKIAKPPNPISRSKGIYFNGWYKEASLETLWDFDTDTVMGFTSIYAKWTRMFEVTYISEYGGYSNTYKVFAGSKLEKPADLTFEHYTFKGWHIRGGKMWNFDTDTVSDDLSLFDEWELNKYTVTFDYQDGRAGIPVLVSYGDVTAQPYVPEKDGYTFEGWYNDTSYATPWDPRFNAVLGNMTLYAKWAAISAVTYTVTYDTQGGSAVAAATGVSSGAKIAKPTDPTRVGHTFEGWYGEASYTTLWSFGMDTVSGNMTLYAKWTAIPAATYTVTYDTQGGSAVAAATGVSSGAKIAKPTDPTRVGHTFEGWYGEASYTTLWSFGMDTVSGNMTLYAKWTAIPASNNANLIALSLSNGSLNPAFVSDTTSYTASLANGVSSLKVKPTAADSKAEVTVNGKAVESGTASEAISLSVGRNTITVAVTAQDGTTTRTYKLIVQRAAVSMVNSATPILVTPGIPVSIEVPLGITDANVAVSPVPVGSNKEATLPLVDVKVATSLGNVSVAIPEGTKITAPASWDGIIKLPVVLSASSVLVNNAEVNAVIEVGSSDVSLTFDHAVRLLIPNMGGKSVGFVIGGMFTPITGTISEDTQAAADSEIAAGGEAKITVGSDIVIWTKHFTKFVAYTPVTITPDTPPTAGNDGGSTPSDRFTVGAFFSAEFTLGDVKFSIPEGATDKTIQVTVDKVADISKLPKNVSLQRIGDVYEVKKNSDGEFIKPVTIGLTFDKSKVDFNKNEAAVYWLNEQTNKWVVLDNAKVDQASATVSGSVTHFGKFAVLVSERVQIPSPSTSETILTDIKGHWAEANIRDLVQTGAINGYTDRTFKPNDSITRAEFVSILVKALRLTAPDGSAFDDTTDHWAKDLIGTAAALGIVSGFEDHTFRPNDLITREQMAVMVVRALKLDVSSKPVSFLDNSDVSSWATEAIAAAAENGLINGYEDGTFRAKINTTRAEAAVVILKAIALHK
ncbi:InlB B-repeat-containing protein [Paenibacillus sinopodophylli]|uniref:InlB B-repeat-containing protein n=1 Tax=Paenibacillus sinopodophylli TaxID=1837342 RepID=UPI00110D159F|nr:InlB B-repeat-containing protein [Paenibacillus sinopodophylli]